MDFRLLGPLEVRDGDRLVAVGGPKQRALLAILLLHANQVLPAEQLVKDLWGEAPPETPENTLHAHISRLRKALGKTRILTRSPGYVLTLDDDERDVERFEALVAEGRRALGHRHAARASAVLGDALKLWRGPPLADLSLQRFAQAEIRRLEEARLGALEDMIEANLVEGLHAEVIPELEALVVQHPLRERLRAQLMLALYRSGRQAEALEVYRSTRQVLVDELGIEPGPALHQLETAILLHDPALKLDPAQRFPPAPQLAAGERNHVAVEARHGQLDTPLIGRDVELAQLRQMFEASRIRRVCHLATVLGPPGIGKSRLGQELCAELRVDALTVVGRCVPQGEGAAFGPLIEIVKQLAGDTTVEALARLLVHEEQGQLIAERLAGAFGRPGNVGEIEDTFWAGRRLLEMLGRDRPLVVILEDVHWADDAFLDFVEYVTDWSQDASIFLVCLARPELLDVRPEWSGGKGNVASLALDALTDEESSLLVKSLSSGSLLSERDRERVASVAEGNPLFIEQMLALARENEGEELRVPATINAILAARIDRLRTDERAVVETGSVIGQQFWLGALRDVAANVEPKTILAVLRRLMRKALIRPDRSFLPGEEAFRFGHTLIHDVVYGAVPSGARADLHERVADWLERRMAGRLTEVDETIGHHLEQAYLNLGSHTPASRRQEVARRAAYHLGAVATRELTQSGLTSRIDALTRAAALLPDSDQFKAELHCDIASDLQVMGQWNLAVHRYLDARRLARTSNNQSLEIYVSLRVAECRLRTEPSGSVGPFIRRATRGIRELDSLYASEYSQRIRASLASALLSRGKAQVAAESLEDVLSYSVRHKSLRLLNVCRRILTATWVWGPTQVLEGIDRCRALLGDQPPLRVAASAQRSLAVLLAMRGAFDEARECLARDREILEHLGLGPAAAGAREVGGLVEMLAGKPDVAEAVLRPGFERLATLSESWYLGGVAAVLAQAVFAQGRADEAWHLTEVCRRMKAKDVAIPIRALGVRAQCLARRRHATEAEKCARRAVRLAVATDFVSDHAEACMTLSHVLGEIGRVDQAARAAQDAAHLWERKGNIVAAEAAQRALAA